jgi:6-phosphogluconolactonase (cycloisomerase 2 family)
MKKPFSMLIAGLIVFSGFLQAANFVYTNNDVIGANSVSAFSVDAGGVLTEIPNSPFLTGGGGTGGGGFAINRVVVAGSGKYLYVSNGGTYDISAFLIDSNTGGLTLLAGSPFPAGTALWGDISLAAAAEGGFLFAGVASNRTVVTFRIGADGSLAQMSSVPVPAAPEGMKVTNDGQYLAVALPSFAGGAIAMFSIAANGGLTLVNNFLLVGAGLVAGVDINCAGSQLFGGRLSQTGMLVDAYAIGAAGVLSKIPGSPFSSSTGLNSATVLLSPDDKRLFVGNQISNTVAVFDIDSTGALTMVGNAPFPIDILSANPAGMATDQAGAFLYVASSPGLIHVFGIGPDGTLTPTADSPFSTGQGNTLLSLAAFPAKGCGAGPGGGEPPPPPVISGLPGEGCTLWPPDHQFIEVGTVSAADELSGLASFEVTGTSSEISRRNDPDVVITGSGLEPRTVYLRAARLGSEKGRIYTLTATAKNRAGGMTTSTTTCTVPHDQR